MVVRSAIVAVLVVGGLALVATSAVMIWALLQLNHPPVSLKLKLIYNITDKRTALVIPEGKWASILFECWGAGGNGNMGQYPIYGGGGGFAQYYEPSPVAGTSYAIYLGEPSNGSENDAPDLLFCLGGGCTIVTTSYYARERILAVAAGGGGAGETGGVGGGAGEQSQSGRTSVTNSDFFVDPGMPGYNGSGGVGGGCDWPEQPVSLGSKGLSASYTIVPYLEGMPIPNGGRPAILQINRVQHSSGGGGSGFGGGGSGAIGYLGDHAYTTGGAGGSNYSTNSKEDVQEGNGRRPGKSDLLSRADKAWGGGLDSVIGQPGFVRVTLVRE